ncbi:hypothetical protein FOZ61_000883 [Perkinsus olseni]|uniref:Uncharacterized protein n=1 Tax=Perkinsus olseni TaxID=32597 RepID=A0A7J6LYH2_PEROL|nr:hypothetical protein FOZ61_000883 [Perkinsus olseni]
MSDPTNGYGPLWATIGAANQVNQHIGCSARSVKLVAKKQIFLILPDRDASAGLKAGSRAVRIFPCSMNPPESLRQWHAEGEVPENAVAMSWATLSGKTRSSKGRVKVEAKVIGPNDRNAWWIMSTNEFMPGTVSFRCREEEYHEYYIRHNNDKIDACIEEVGSSGFRQAASFNLLLRSDCDPRMNRNGSSVMNISIDPSVLEDNQRHTETVESQPSVLVEKCDAEEDSSADASLEPGVEDDSPVGRGASGIQELPVSPSESGELEEEDGGRDDDTDASSRSQKRTRDVRSDGKKLRKKNNSDEESTPEAKPSDPKRKRRDSSGSVEELLVSGRIDRRSSIASYQSLPKNVFDNEGPLLARPSGGHDSVFDLTLDHDEGPDVSRIDPAPATAAYEELEEARRALSSALDKDLESQQEIKLLRKQLETARKSSKEARELKQLRKEFDKAREEFERSQAEAREKIRTLQRELALELEAKDDALNQTEALEEKLEGKQAAEEEAACTIKSLKKELKQKSERLRAVQQHRDDEITAEDGKVAALQQELEEAQRLQEESQDVIKSLRSELEGGEARMRELRKELEEVKDGADDSTSTLRAELEAAEEARNVGQAALTKLEADLADEKAKVAELREEQEAADRRWQEIQSEKQAKEAENEELKRTLKSMEKLPAELEAAKARRNEAEIAMFGLESEIDALKEQLEEKEKEIKKRVEAQAEKESANGNAGKPPLPPANTGKPSSGGNRRESREVRSRLSLEMDEAVAGLLGAGAATTAVSEEEQSVDKYKKIIIDLQEKIKVQDGWLDECEFDISKWEGRYRHEQEEHDETRRKYGEVAETLKRAEGKRAELKAEAQRLLLDLERVTEEKQALEQAVKELDKAVAAEARKPETRTTATSTSMSMRSLISYEQRFEAMKAETAKLKQDAEALEGSKRAVELNAQKAEEKIDFMRSQKKELEGALGLLTDKLTVVDAERTRLLHALSLAQDELKALKTGIAGVSDYNAAIKEAMRDAQRSAHRRVSTVDDAAAAGCKNTSRNDAAVGCKDTVREDASAGHENTFRDDAAAGQRDTAWDDVAASREDTSRNDAPPGAVTVANTGTFKSAHNFWAAKANTGPWEKRRDKIPKVTELPSQQPVPARVLPRIEPASETQEKQPPQAGALSPLSVRMSEMGPVRDRNSPEEVDDDKENAPAQANPVEAKPFSRAEVKIKPLNPGETPSKIGRPRQPALMGDVSPSSASVPHRQNRMLQICPVLPPAQRTEPPSQQAKMESS